MENYYARTWSLREDLKILGQSLRGLFSRKTPQSATPGKAGGMQGS